MVESRARTARIPIRARQSAPAAAREDSAARGIDDRLMAELGRGRIAALEELYDRYSVLVYSVSLRILHDEVLAEDVTQEVFLRLWQRPQSYDPSRGRFLSWLMSITRNRAIDERRRLSRRQRIEDESADPTDRAETTDRFDDPVLAATIGDERAAVREAIAALPVAQRRVIELAYFGGLTQVEIAEVTRTPLGTVKTRVRLAMNKLRASLDEQRRTYVPPRGGE